MFGWEDPAPTIAVARFLYMGEGVSLPSCIYSSKIVFRVRSKISMAYSRCVWDMMLNETPNLLEVTSGRLDRHSAMCLGVKSPWASIRKWFARFDGYEPIHHLPPIVMRTLGNPWTENCTAGLHVIEELPSNLMKFLILGKCGEETFAGQKLPGGILIGSAGFLNGGGAEYCLCSNQDFIGSLVGEVGNVGQVDADAS